MTVTWVDQDGKEGMAENAYDYAMSVKPVPMPKENPFVEQEQTNEQVDKHLSEWWRNLGIMGRNSNTDDLGPVSENVEDRRGESRPGLGALNNPNYKINLAGPVANRDESVDQNQAWLEEHLHNYVGKISQALGMSSPEDTQQMSLKQHLGEMINTAMSVMGPGFKGAVKGTKVLGSADYPHVQQAFTEAYERGITNKFALARELGLDSRVIDKLADKTGKELTTIQKRGFWNEENTAKAVDLVNKGTGYKAIGKELDISEFAVADKMKELGIRNPTRVATEMRWNEENQDRIRTAVKEGKTINEIAEDLGIARSTLSNKAKALGIRLNYERDFKDPERNFHIPAGPDPTATFPHVQEAYKAAVEKGIKGAVAIADEMTAQGTPMNERYVREVSKVTGIAIPSASNASVKWTNSELESLHRSVASGKTLRQIADELGKTPGQISGKMAREGLKTSLSDRYK